MEGGQFRADGRQFVLLSAAVVLTVCLLAVRSAGFRLDVPVTLRPVAALVVAAGLLFGIVAVIGVAAGHLFYEAYYSAPGMISVLETGELALLGTGFAVLVADRPLAGRSFPAELRSHVARPRPVIAGVGVVVSATATLALGYEALGIFRFFPFSVARLLELVVSLGILAGPTVALSWWAFDRFVAGDAPFAHPVDRRLRGMTDTTAFAGLAVLWFLAGNAVSAGVHVAQLVPDSVFQSRGLGFLLQLVDPRLVGHGGRVLQVALGVFFGTLLLGSLYRSRERTR